MKLTCILIMITMLQVSASSYAQKINLEVQKAPLEDVLFTLQQQSGYDFLYSAQLIKMAAPVSLSLKNVSISQALEKIFNDQPLIYLINKKTITLKQKPVSESNNILNIKGKVTDNKGVPLPGVSIMLKGSRTGTVTDANGAFSLNVPDGSGTLVFSFIGFAK